MDGKVGVNRKVDEFMHFLDSTIFYIMQYYTQSLCCCLRNLKFDTEYKRLLTVGFPNANLFLYEVSISSALTGGSFFSISIQS